MPYRKTNVFLIHSYIKAKSITITANRNILERAILTEISNKSSIGSYLSGSKKEGKTSFAKK